MPQIEIEPPEKELAREALEFVNQANKLLLWLGYVLYGGFAIVSLWIFGYLIVTNIAATLKFLALAVPLILIIIWGDNTRKGT